MGDISTASRQKLTNRKLQFMGGLAASCDGDLWPRQLTRFWDATRHVLDNKQTAKWWVWSIQGTCIMS